MGPKNKESSRHEMVMIKLSIFLLVYKSKVNLLCAFTSKYLRGNYLVGKRSHVVNEPIFFLVLPLMMPLPQPGNQKEIKKLKKKETACWVSEYRT